MESGIDRDLLFVLAEVSVAVTGFAGIAGAIGSPKSEVGRRYVRSVVDSGAWTVVLSLLPAFVGLFGLSEETVWRASSGIALIVIVAYWARLLTRSGPKLAFEGVFARISAAGALLSLAVSVANLLGVTGEYYEAGYMYILYWFLIQALFFFYLSIQELWTSSTQ